MSNMNKVTAFSIFLLLVTGCSFDVKDVPPVNPEMISKLIYTSDLPIRVFTGCGDAAIIVDDGVKYLSSGKTEDISFSVNAVASQIFKIKCIGSKFYICTFSGLFEIDPSQKEINGYFTSNQTVSSDRVNDICGNDDILFAATDNGLTVHTLNPALNIQYEKYKGIRTIDSWYSLDTENSPISDNECLKCELIGNLLCIVTASAVTIYDLDLDTVENYSYGEFFDGFKVTAVHSINGRIFFATYNGLYSYDSSTRSWEDYPSSGMVTDLRIDQLASSGDNLYVMTPSQVYSFNTFSGIFEVIVSLSELPGSSFTSIVSKDDELFLGTSAGLISISGPAGVLNKIWNGCVNEVKIGEGGVLTVISEKEIFIFN